VWATAAWLAGVARRKRRQAVLPDQQPIVHISRAMPRRKLSARARRSALLTSKTWTPRADATTAGTVCIHAAVSGSHALRGRSGRPHEQHLPYQIPRVGSAGPSGAGRPGLRRSARAAPAPAPLHGGQRPQRRCATGARHRDLVGRDRGAGGVLLVDRQRSRRRTRDTAPCRSGRQGRRDDVEPSLETTRSIGARPVTVLARPARSTCRRRSRPFPLEAPARCQKEPRRSGSVCAPSARPCRWLCVCGAVIWTGGELDQARANRPYQRMMAGIGLRLRDEPVDVGRDGDVRQPPRRL